MRRFGVLAIAMVFWSVSGVSLADSGDWIHRVTAEYGESVPEIVCAMTKPCLVKLGPGEIVGSFNVGDLTRWEITREQLGSRVLFYVRPRFCDLDGTLLYVGTITTEGEERLYTIGLRGECSDSEDWNNSVGFPATVLDFRYPATTVKIDRKEVLARFARLREQEPREVREEEVPGFDPGLLGWQFRWSKRERRIVSVFEYDGKVFIALAEDAGLPVVRDGKGKGSGILDSEAREGLVVLTSPPPVFFLDFGESRSGKVWRGNR